MTATVGTSLNERLMARLERELGDDPTFSIAIQMFAGNILSVPEVELREQLTRYCSLLQDLLNWKP